MSPVVGDIMDAAIVRLAPDDPIRKAIAALIKGDQPAGMVLDDAGQLCGILTQKDCFRPALHASYYQEWRGTVADHMTRQVITIDASDDMVRAAEILLDLPHRVLPVLDDGRLVGLLHRSAVMAALFELGR